MKRASERNFENDHKEKISKYGMELTAGTVTVEEFEENAHNAFVGRLNDVKAALASGTVSPCEADALKARLMNAHTAALRVAYHAYLSSVARKR